MVVDCVMVGVRVLGWVLVPRVVAPRVLDKVLAKVFVAFADYKETN